MVGKIVDVGDLSLWGKCDDLVNYDELDGYIENNLEWQVIYA